MSTLSPLLRPSQTDLCGYLPLSLGQESLRSGAGLFWCYFHTARLIVSVWMGSVKGLLERVDPQENIRDGCVMSAKSIKVSCGKRAAAYQKISC